MKLTRHLLTVVLAMNWLILGAWGPSQSTAASLELKKGDHICLIGNTLADRMQHDGWLETIIQSRYPDHELVFRNLGVSADELALRLRSANFGSPEQHLTFSKADVVFAFFGYNESFGGKAGLEKFKSDLAGFIKETLAARYNGKSAPRLVLFSPIAIQDLGDRNLPDGRENNARIALYTKAMEQVAKEHGVPLVNLFAATQQAYGKTKDALTINGLHLNTAGNRVVGEIIDRALFGEAPRRDEAAIEKIRQAVIDKNFYWFNRYRTTDGYNVYGGRSGKTYKAGKNGDAETDGVTRSNREVMDREMEILDVQTANRDRRVWAVARGGDLKVDDSNTPPFIPVGSNKPGPLPGGKHKFLSGEEAITKMKVAEGMQVNLFASEEMFPELISPVQMAWDTKGRLWVATWPTYPHWTPKTPMNDRLLILEDSDGDGKADSCQTFVDDLHNPTGFEFWGGGVVVAMAPDVLFLQDTDGDDVADVRTRIINGIDSADTHHTINSFVLDPGGALYFQEGTFHHTQTETPYGRPERSANGGVFRYDPRRKKFEVYVPHRFANPHGHVFDRWGQDVVHDGTGAVPYHGTLFSVHTVFPRKLSKCPVLYNKRTRPCPGTEILSSRHFPEANQGNLLVGNVIGFQGILQYKFEDRDSSFGATEVEPILSSTDQNFRPTDIEIGPDGALYFTDWQNPIIGHLQHHIRDPNRDKEHGRIYRVTCKGRKLLEPPQIAGAPVDDLLELLKSPEDRVRYRAKIELSGRATEEVMSAVTKWMASLDKQDPEYEHHMMEALWMHQHHNTINVDLLKRMLGSKDYRARAAATRVLCYWRDLLDDPMALLKNRVADDHPRVRLEAVRACSFYLDSTEQSQQAMELALQSLAKPQDTYLKYVLDETLKTLQQGYKPYTAPPRKKKPRKRDAAAKKPKK